MDKSIESEKFGKGVKNKEDIEKMMFGFRKAKQNHRYSATIDLS
jgi:hypothetical protein